MKITAEEIAFNKANEINVRLAKLLASEDITVIIKNVKTAKFSLKKRVLMLPNWKDMEYSTRAALTAHEVGHALFTPVDGWNDYLVKYPKMKPLINICEDSRVDRKIWAKYPGCKKDYVSSYRELHIRDFYSLKGKDLSALSFGDRANLYYNSNPMDLIIPFFDDEEIKLRDAIAKTETFDDVIRIAEQIFMFMKKKKDEADDQKKKEQEQQEQENQNKPDDVSDGNPSDPEDNSNDEDQQEDNEDTEPDDDSESDSNPDDPSDDDSSSDNEPDESEEPGDDSNEDGIPNESGDIRNDDSDDQCETEDESDDGYGVQSDDENQQEDAENIEPDGDSGCDESGTNPNADGVQTDTEPDDNEPSETNPFGHGEKSDKQESEFEYDEDVETDVSTDQALQENLANIADPTDIPVFVPMPTFDKRIIIPYRTIYDIAKKEINIFDRLADKAKEFFRKDNKLARNVAQTLKEQFDIHKQAADYNEETTFDSGMIDIDLIYNYQVSDKLFKDEVFRVDNNTKHRLIFVLDCSGSMDGIKYQKSIFEIMIITMFCDMAKIPYDVYGFFTDDAVRKSVTKIRNKSFTQDSGPHIDGGDFFMGHLISSVMPLNQRNIVFHYLYMMSFSSSKLSFILDGTPLNEAVLWLTGILDAMVTDEKVSVILLTDGESDRSIEVYAEDHDMNNYTTEYYITDKMGYNHRIDNYSPQKMTASLIEMLSRKCHSLNWYLVSSTAKLSQHHSIAGVLGLDGKYQVNAINNEYQKSHFVMVPVTANVECTLIHYPNDYSIINVGAQTPDDIRSDFIAGAVTKKVYRLMCESLGKKIA